jgi:hypothetical protein
MDYPIKNYSHLLRLRSTLLLIVLVFRSHTDLGAEDYSNSLTIRPQLEQKSIGFRLSPTQKLENKSEDSGLGIPKPLKFQPNTKLALGIGLSYKGLALNFSRDDTQNEDRVAANGFSTGDNYSLSFEHSKIFLTLYHQNLRGFYLTDQDGDGEPEKFPNLRLVSTGITVINIVNPQAFSLAAILDQSKRQTTSGGSILMSFSVNSNLLSHNLDRIIPESLRQPYAENANLVGMKMDEVNCTAGYGYLLTRSNFYGAFALGIGPSMKFLRIESAEQISETSSDFSTATIVIVGLGYNGPDLFLGANYTNEMASSTSESLQFELNRQRVQQFVGWRF